jgi:methionyl-tRNA formyltransferase
MINIGILTNIDDKFLPFLINKIKNLKNRKFYLIVSKTKKKNSKSQKIFKERTGNYFSKHNLDLFNLNFNLDYPIFLVNSHNSKKFHKIIKLNNIKYLYNSGTPNKINKVTLKKVKGIINIHPGVLPYYRGCTCPEWTLFNKDALGITAHYMNEFYDGGQIIEVQYIKFKKRDIREYKDIRIKIYLSTLELAKKIFKKIDNIKTYPQDESKAKYHGVIKNNYLKKIKDEIKKKIYPFSQKNLI